MLAGRLKIAIVTEEHFNRQIWEEVTMENWSFIVCTFSKE